MRPIMPGLVCMETEWFAVNLNINVIVV